MSADTFVLVLCLGAAFVGTFGVALPALTYMFLAAAWLLRLMVGYFQQPRL